eukprot:4769256-Pyramimonas_sp.AAC.1
MSAASSGSASGPGAAALSSAMRSSAAALSCATGSNASCLASGRRLGAERRDGIELRAQSQFLDARGRDGAQRWQPRAASGASSASRARGVASSSGASGSGAAVAGGATVSALPRRFWPRRALEK